MIEITNARATTLAETPFGHLLLCWVSGHRFSGIRVITPDGDSGFLAFNAQCGLAEITGAALFESTDPDVCLDVGAAAVHWTGAVATYGCAVAGNLTVDANGVANAARL